MLNDMELFSIPNSKNVILQESQNFPLSYTAPPLSSANRGNRSLIQSVQSNNCQRLFKVSYRRERLTEGQGTIFSSAALPKNCFFPQICPFIAKTNEEKEVEGNVTPKEKVQTDFS